MPERQALPPSVSRMLELNFDKARARTALLTTRVLLGAVGTVYPAWYLFVQWVVPSFVDSLSERLIVGGLAWLVLGLTFLDFGSRHVAKLGEVMAVVVTVHFFTLVARNDNAVWASYGLLIILAGANFSLLTLSATARLTAVALVLAALLLAFTPAHRLDSLAMFGGVVAVQLIAVLAAWRRERTEADRAADLRHGVRLLDQVLAMLPEPLFLKDSNGLIVLVNPATAAAFGLPAAEIIGKTLPEIIGPEFSRNMVALDQLALQSNKPVRAEQATLGPDGELRMWNTVVTKLERGGREPLLLGLASDRTEQKRKDDALRQAKEAAEAALRAKSEFLAKVSHEIRTPMNGVLLALELARLPKSAEKLDELLDIAQISAQSLLRIVDDILDAAKIESGMLRLESIRTDLPALVTDVGRLHVLAAKHKGLEVQINVGASVPQWVMTDPVRLRQVLSNLLSNAIKFTERGFVRLDVSAEILQESQSYSVTFVVQDSGIGISTDRQQAIFGAFVQEDDSTTRRFGGTGLGLTIVRQLVLGLGGDLKLLSTSGQGSSFVVTLPFQVAAVQPAGQPATGAALVEESLELLLVDDNPINLAVTEHLLRLLGHKPALASSAADAMRWLTHNRADVVLMDVHMPDVDGLAATRLLRDQGIAVPIVALTAQAMPGDRERCLAAGMDGYLRKPLEPDKLQAELAAVLALRQDLPAVHSRSDLYRFVGDQALADQLLALFSKDWQVLRNGWLQPAEPGKLQASIHRVRGSLLHFGLDQLAHRLELAEADLRGGEPAAVAAVLAQAPQLAEAVDAAMVAWQIEVHPDAAQ